jgi:hypothetical protein
VPRSDVPKKLSTVVTTPPMQAACLCELRARSEREGVCSCAGIIVLIRIVLVWSCSCSGGGVPAGCARRLSQCGPAPACTTRAVSARTGGTLARPAGMQLSASCSGVVVHAVYRRSRQQEEGHKLAGGDRAARGGARQGRISSGRHTSRDDMTSGRCASG